MSYILKGIKYNIIQLEIVINIIFKQVLTVFQMLVLAFGMLLKQKLMYISHLYNARLF